MKKVWTFYFLSLWATPFMAQTATVDNPAANNTFKDDQLSRALDTRSMRNVIQFDNRYEGVKGTPFWYADWTSGRLQVKDSVYVKSAITFKFDLVNNEIWIKTPELGERVLFSKGIMSLEITRPDGQKLLLKKVKLPEGAEPSYHYLSVMLFEGKHFTLVKDMKKVFRKANLQDKGIVTVGNPYDWFEDINKYYIQRGQEKFVEINLKRTNLIELMDKSVQKEVEKFCKDKGLHGKLTDAEAVELVAFMDGIFKN
jgi:hypothetical protein